VEGIWNRVTQKLIWKPRYQKKTDYHQPVTDQISPLKLDDDKWGEQTPRKIRRVKVLQGDLLVNVKKAGEEQET
jgi:hypothetical protein